MAEAGGGAMLRQPRIMAFPAHEEARGSPDVAMALDRFVILYEHTVIVRSASLPLSPVSSLSVTDPSSPAPLTPERLHPSLWRGSQLGQSRAGTVASGQPVLDAELPGGGWPKQGLVELLVPHIGIGEWRLVAPALVAAQRNQGLVMVFDPPAEPVASALAGLGLTLDRLVVVRSVQASPAAPGAPRRPSPRDGAAACWALEQGLKSGHLGAVLAWLPPHLPPEAMRRLQAAAARHEGVAFVLREPEASLRPSPAPVRLHLQPAGPDRLQVQVLKRRGPPLEQPLVLDLPPVLSPLAQRRAAVMPGRWREARRAGVAAPGGSGVNPRPHHP